MDHIEKTVAQTGDGIRRIDKTKNILLIGSAKKRRALEWRETYRVFHSDTVRQAWSLVYRQPIEDARFPSKD
ncbi:MAG: hypothetical protein ACXW50_23490 [Candidatus Binatia bacterium]